MLVDDSMAMVAATNVEKMSFRKLNLPFYVQSVTLLIESTLEIVLFDSILM